MALGARQPSNRYVLQIIEGPLMGRTVPIVKAKTLIGRLRSCDLAMPDSMVSARHAVISLASSGCTIQDVGSTHGTTVNGQRTMGQTPLDNGAVIVVGKSKFVVRMLPGVGPVPTAPAKDKEAKEEPKPDVDLTGVELEDEEEPDLSGIEAEATESEFDDLLPDGDVDAALEGMDISQDEDAPSALDFLEPQSKSPLMSLIQTVVVIVVLGVGGYYGYKFYKETLAHRGKTAYVNLIEANPSFDGEVNADGWPRGWQVEGKGHKWSVAKSSDGTKFATVQCTDDCGAETPSALASTEPIAALDTIGYRLSGWIKTVGCKGVATLRLRWGSGEYPNFAFDQFLDVVTGDEDWAQITRVLPTPPHATKIRVACVVHGKLSEVAFDQITLHDSSALKTETVPTNYEIAFPHTLTIIPTQRGVVNVLRKSQPVLWNGEVTLSPAGLQGCGRQALSNPDEGYPSSEKEAKTIVFGGRMFMPGAKRAIHYILRLKGHPDGIQLNYSLTSSAAIEQLAPGVAFAIDPDMASEGAVVLKDGRYVYQPKTFELTGVGEIAWGTGDDLVVLAYDPPGTLSYHVADGQHVVAYHLQPQSLSPNLPIEVRVSISNFSTKRDELFEDALAKVKDLIEKKQFGQAIKLAREEVQVALYSADQRRQLRGQVYTLLTKIDAIVAQLQEQLDAAVESKSPQALVSVEQSINALLEAVKGSEAEPKVAALKTKLAEARLRQRAIIEAAAKAYLDRANAHRAKGEILLGRIYLENLLRLFPQTETAKNAAKLIETFRAEAKAKEQKQRWIDTRMTLGQNNERNKVYPKAKAAYQEVLDKYPDAPEAAKAKQRIVAIDNILRKMKKGQGE